MAVTAAAGVVRGSGVADKAVAVAVNGGRVLALSVLGCGWAGAVGIAGAVLLHPLSTRQSKTSS